jgi:hypothetical protein
VAHSFDTGLAKPQRALVRDAVLARLAPLRRTAGGAGGAGGELWGGVWAGSWDVPWFGEPAEGDAPPSLYVNALKGIPSRLDRDDVDYILHTVGGQFPAILVALGRKTYRPAGLSGPRDQYQGTLEVFVYVASDNARSPDLARVAGDAAAAASNERDPGTETMLEHVEELLLGYQPPSANDTVYQLVPLEESELWHGFGDNHVTVWEQRYEVAVQRDLLRHKDVDETLVDIDTLSNLDGADEVNPVARTLTTLSM